jgi:glucose-1-phosphate adenylyltransferase
VTPDDATQMGIFMFDGNGHVNGFEEKPNAERLREMGSSAPRHAPVGELSPDKPFVASMGIYVFSRDVLYEVLASTSAVDFGKEVIPQALATHRVHPYLYRGFWADVGTVQSFYDVNLMFTRRGTPFSFFHPKRPIYTHARFLPAARIHECHVDEALVAEGAYLDTCDIRNSIVGIRTTVQHGARISRSILLGADYYDDSASDLPLGIGKDAVLDKVIVDKNARIGDGVKLTNERGIENADGDGYYIRSGIIIVPKGAVVKPGTVV